MASGKTQAWLIKVNSEAMSGPSKAEVWMVDLGGSKGHEQKGQRPGILWRDLNHVKMAVVIPCTTTPGSEKFPHAHLISPTPENGFSEDSIALIFQITTIDKKRLIKRLGKLDEEDIKSMAGLLKELLYI